jgi:endonuclease/exonuclease/phosphatase family metal-dependent hydrolase
MKRLITVFLFFLVPFLLRSQNDPCGNSDLKVMTYNIRFNNPDDGPNAWVHRKQAVINLIITHNPDLLGVQEALMDQINDIGSELANYKWFGAGRDDGREKGEFSAIFYRNDKFELLDGATFWLSATPDIPGSMGWDAACTRIVTWIKLRENSSGLVLFHFNTHFDHMGDTARLESARLLMERIRKIAGDAPVIVTGDFNLKESEEPYQLLTNSSAGYNLLDARHQARESKGPDYTYIGFDFVGEPGEIIDYIFYHNLKETSSLQIITENKNGIYPSDHLPVEARIRY